MSRPASNIVKQLTSLMQCDFTGTLDIKSSSSRQWRLFFRLGRLIWAANNYHPNRFCRRHLKKYCPQINLKKIQIRSSDEIECYNYQILAILSQRKLVKIEQVKALIKSQVEDIIFDLIQQEITETLCYKVSNLLSVPVHETALKTSFALVNVEAALELAQKNWLAWCKNGLMSVNPNLAPIIKNPERLRQEVSEIVDQNFSELIDGNKTLRDLAFETKSDVVKVTYSLITYIDKGLLELVEISDIKPPIELVKPPVKLPLIPVSVDKPLIACVDDSPSICQSIEQIITQHGYRFIGIQNSFKVTLTLLKQKPDFIFLDLLMPIVNGYEICTQLRRVATFEKVPIVILTGKDGLVDRMRAKLVGSNDFLSKPVEAEQVLKMIEKHLKLGQRTGERRSRQKQVIPM
ncbi:MAG: response regulator [Prochloraceae cyanobacterium]|nr:response regulator [Prochloraceae cyanobacterium]